VVRVPIARQDELARLRFVEALFEQFGDFWEQRDPTGFLSFVPFSFQ
jgi:hypothetical protein